MHNEAVSMAADWRMDSGRQLKGNTVVASLQARLQKPRQAASLLSAATSM